jgi:hypothetical protein
MPYASYPLMAAIRNYLPNRQSGINFDKRAIVQPRGQAAGEAICFFTDINPDYDCIVISQRRIIMGKLKKQPDSGGECYTDNCAKK